MRIVVEPAEVAAFAQDYGRASVRTPLLVAFPETVDDVREALRVARSRGLAVRARSGGHGLEGGSLSEGGMVIATTELKLPSGAFIEHDAAANAVRVTPRMTTGAIAEWLAARRLRLTSTTMDRFPAIGGAIATAGIGQGSHRHGSLADQVSELGGVLGNGEDVDAETASFMRGGLGHAGIITHVALPVVPIRGHLRVFRRFHGSLHELTEALDTRDEAVAIWGAIMKHPKRALLTYMTSTVRDVWDPSEGVPLESAGDPGADPDVLPAWLDLVCPKIGDAERVLDAHPDLRSTLLTTPGMILLIPYRKTVPDRVTFNAWPQAKVGDLQLALGVFYYGDRKRAAAMVAELRQTRDDAITCSGAQPYYMDGIPTDWSAALGPVRHAAIARVLDRADPERVIARLPGL